MLFRKLAVAALAVAALTGPAVAQERPTLSIAQSDEYGDHIAGPQGPAYVFLTDLMAGDDQAAIDSCNAPCRKDWPPLSVEGEISVGPGLDPDLAAQLTHEGANFAVYNSYALFYFHRDSEGEEPQGHGLSTYGGWWALLGPDGRPVRTGLLPAQDGELN